MANGTHPTQIRLTADDRLKIDVIRQCFGIWSLSQAIRYALSAGYYTIPIAERERLTARVEKAATKAMK